jgi:uncharacterized membrane protein
MIESIDVKRGAVSPLACYQEGWELIKGEYWVIFAATAVGMLLGSIVPMGILLGPMMCGIYLILLRRMRGETVLVDHLFKGFEWFGPSLVAFLLTLVAVLLLVVPLGLVVAVAAFVGNAAGGEDLALLLALVVGAVGLLVVMAAGTLFTFAYPLMVDRDLEAMDALKVSVRGGLANLGGLIGLFAMNVVLSLVGTCFFFVGSYLVMPLSFAALAIAYRDVYGLADLPAYRRLGLDPVAPPGA